MRRWGILTLLVVVIVVSAIAAAMFRPGVPVQLADVRRNEIREYIDERGKTRVPRVYRVTTPQSGRVEEIALQEGSVVKTGQVVARFVSEDLENTVDEARAVVERLAAAIAENDDVSVENIVALQATQFVNSMTNTVEAAKAQMDSSAKRSEFAETNLGRIQRLQKSGARTEDDLDRATLQYWEGQLGFRQNTLTVEAMKSIRAATALLPQMVQDYISRKGLTRGVLEAQKSEAEARLRQVLTQRERGTMKSPVDGVILHRNVVNEQQLSAGTELLTIGRLDRLEVEADVLSQDVVQVENGDLVEIYGPAVGRGLGKGVPGRIHRIYPAGFTKVSSLGVEQQRVKVVVRFDEATSSELRQRDVGVDYRVRVRIFTQIRPDALVVPRSALFRSPDGGWQLFVAQGKRAMLHSVSVGLMNDATVEITEGLDEGQQVILAPDTKLSHGSRVSPILE